MKIMAMLFRTFAVYIKLELTTMRRGLVLPFLCVLTVASAAVGDLPQKGVPLSKVRNELLAAGWKPRETFLVRGRGERMNQWGDAGELYRAGFIEVVGCSGTGLNYCSFNYVRGSECLVLSTQGEFSPGKYEPTVFRRSSECPSAEELGIGQPTATKQYAP